MYRLLLSILFLLLLPNINFAQTSGELVARADSLYRAKSYQLSGETYDLAFVEHQGAAGALFLIRNH